MQYYSYIQEASLASRRMSRELINPAGRLSATVFSIIIHLYLFMLSIFFGAAAGVAAIV